MFPTRSTNYYSKHSIICFSTLRKAMWKFLEVQLYPVERLILLACLYISTNNTSGLSSHKQNFTRSIATRQFFEQYFQKNNKILYEKDLFLRLCKMCLGKAFWRKSSNLAASDEHVVTFLTKNKNVSQGGE